jgi:hypothetical protein
MEETHICNGRDPCVSNPVVTMVKQTKFFRKQADKAEQAARRASDPDRAAGLRAMALAYRSQADVLKRNKKGRKTKPAD